MMNYHYLAYNATDVTLVPSLQENLSNVIMESMSFGTPAVAFDIGGNSDLIDHRVNGYLAQPIDVEGIALGIKWVLYSSEQDEIRLNPLNKAFEQISNELCCQKV